MGLFSKRDAAYVTASGVTIENVREDKPQFKRTYSAKLADRGTVTITIKTFIGNSRFATGEMTQHNGRWIIFEPERIADKIVDPVLVPLVEQFVKEVFALDKAFTESDPSEFVDESGTTWRKIKA